MNMESSFAGVASEASVKLITCVESPAVTKLTSYILFLTIGSVSAANTILIPSASSNPSTMYPVCLTTELNASVVTVSYSVTDLFATVP